MYIGADFLIDQDLNLYLSEVNTGVPGGAQEYDFVYRAKHGKPSGVFDRVNSLSMKRFRKNFYDYIHGLSYMDDLRILKVWMDGKGPLPKNPSSALRLEDKWIQYLLLSSDYPMIPTQIYDPENENELQHLWDKGKPIVLKQRLTRGGQGFLQIENISKLRALRLKKNTYIAQPFVNSQVLSYKLSVRAVAFLGEFICMFANLSPRLTSNHGFRFYLSPGDDLKVTDENFKTKRIVQKAWEADVFFKGAIPDYLYDNVYIEDIAEAELIMPQHICDQIKTMASSISQLYSDLDFDFLPKSIIESSG